MNSRILACPKHFLPQRKLQTLFLSILDRGYVKERYTSIDPFNPLDMKSDYSFEDGRPVPIGSNMRKRLEKQRGYAVKIIQLSKEIDFAIERHEKIEAEKEECKNKIIQRKLTAKGDKELQ